MFRISSSECPDGSWMVFHVDISKLCSIMHFRTTHSCLGSVQIGKNVQRKCNKVLNSSNVYQQKPIFIKKNLNPVWRAA